MLTFGEPDMFRLAPSLATDPIKLYYCLKRVVFGGSLWKSLYIHASKCNNIVRT